MPRPSRRAFAAWSALAVLLLAAMAWQPSRDLLQTVDDAVWEWVVSAEQPVLVWLAELLDLVGSTVVMAIVTAIIGLTLWIRDRRLRAVTLVLAMATAQLTNVVLKYAYQRPRPPMPLISESTWSFPSGHSVMAGALVAVIVYVVPAGESTRRTWLVAGSIYVAAMAFSRVYLRVHWLSDVTAGVAEGVAVATLVVLLAGLAPSRNRITRTDL